MVNNTPVAQGEVVLVNERYGIKLTSVIPTVDQIQKSLRILLLMTSFRICRMALNDWYIFSCTSFIDIHFGAFKKNGTESKYVEWKEN